MHARAPQRLARGRFDDIVQTLCRLASIDLRRCSCTRCIAARSGIFRRTRTWTGHRAYADVHVLGIRISHRFAFELPMTTPPPVACGALVGGAARRRRAHSSRRSGATGTLTGAVPLC